MSQSNLTATLFTLGLVYLGQLTLCFTRTYKQVFKPGPRDEFQKTFMVFYIFVWVTLALTITLYFLLCSRSLKDGDTTTIGAIILYFVPTILMVMCYIIIYRQCEVLMSKGRIPGTDSYSNKKISEKVSKCVDTTYYGLIIIFIGVQALCMVLAIFEWMSLGALFGEITGFTIAIILGSNIYLVIQYCKMTGTPYKNRKNYTSAKWVGVVGGYWSCAFILKFTGVVLGSSLYQIDVNNKYQQVFQACLIGLIDFFCVVIPVFLISDTHFVKIFTAKHLNPKYASITQFFEITTDDNFGFRETQIALLSVDQPTRPLNASVNTIVSTAVNYILETPYLNESKVEQFRINLEKKLIVQPEKFSLQEPFKKDYYSQKQKLGKLVFCEFEQSQHLCRVMEFERINSYQLETYFSQLTQIHMLKLQQFVTTPVAVYINEHNTIHVISTVRQSLYELLHVTKTVVPTFIKLQILVLLAKIVNTLHCLKHRCWAHGNLTSHNVFVEIQGTEVRVQVDGFEYADLKKYANKFYCYRPISVWSPPEVMKAPKKYFDPESTMDVYSFGVMMWELFHEQVPFDGNTTAATKLVLDNTRPMIIEEGEETPCTEPMANLIRKCWTSEPAERPTFNFVIEQLLKELSFFQNKDESSSSDE